MPMTLNIPRRLTVDVADHAEASKAYAQARDLSGEGSSTFAHGTIEEGGKVVAYVSYNAKVWADDPGRRDWVSTAPLFNPYASGDA